MIQHGALQEASVPTCHDAEAQQQEDKLKVRRGSRKFCYSFILIIFWALLWGVGVSFKGHSKQNAVSEDATWDLVYFKM